MNRRELLAAAVGLPAGTGVLIWLSGCQEQSSACVDPNELTAAEESLRRSVNYIGRSPDRERTCSGCAFFTADTGGAACGTCQLLDQGPVDAAGRCDSWSAA